MPEIEAPKPTSFTCALVSGASAGLFVDIALFPIDTLKTRLQSPHGFFKAGGFRGIYSGLSATALGSAPGASLFFSTYETMKAPAKKVTSSDVLSQQLAASVGECVACLVRVPTEVVKQNMQAGNYSTMGEATRSLFATEGIGGFYRGFLSTVMREIPFSLIQFPLWEGSKKKWGEAQGRPVSPWQGTICGALSGGFSGAITTPLDLAKTRLMLGADAQGVPYKGVFDVW
eukprot:CAMPEP_0114512560 /NCGR_PEP_ID=MMETSP0109-20121206/15046_1 /TAXON_ID=29199 /ORGANISM="Chlorarachnion reptans, Strain CCCM449" /LENGTH=229 /DNA_ID=CAMNT_0001692263 /DNA_START=51 /DNA_END=737 /DNA_ORIENTATION=-